MNLRRTVVAILAASLLAVVTCNSMLAAEPELHSWTFAGPRDVVGWVHRMVFDPADPQVVYAGCDDSMGFYRSTDGGQSWQKVLAYGEGLDSWSLDVGPEGRLYVGDHFGRGIQVSADGGETFLLGQGEHLDYVSSIAAHPSTVGVAFASIGLTSDADGQGGNGPPLSDRGYIVKTTDGGLNWSVVDGGLPTDAAYRLVWIHPADPQIMLAARTLDIYRSADGGVSWIRLPLDSPIPFGTRYVGASAFAASPFAPNRMIATTIMVDATIFATTAVYEVWKSEDYGESFEVTTAPKSTWLPFYDVVAAADEDLFYALGYVESDHGVLLSRANGGTEWTPVVSAPPHAWLGATFPPDRPGELLAGAFGVGVYLYESTPESWTLQSQGLAGAGCLGLAVLPGEPERWIAGCGNVGLQPVVARSDDQGETWQGIYLPDLEFHGWTDELGQIINPLLPVLADRTIPDLVLLGGDRVHRSIDRGETWADVPDTSSTWNLEQGAGGAIFASGISLVHRSLDGGQTFEVYGALACPGVRVQVFPDPNLSGQVYASCEAEDAAINGFYRRADESSDWIQLTDPPAPAVERAATFSKDSFNGDLAAVTMIDADNASVGPPDERQYSAHLWVSSDDGASWTDRTPPLECAVIQSVLFLSDLAGHLIVGGNSADGTCPGIPGRIWESFNSGASWRDATTNLPVPDSYAGSLHEHPDLPGGLFLGTYYDGYYRWVVPPQDVQDLGWHSSSTENLEWTAGPRATAWDVGRGLLSQLHADRDLTGLEPFSCLQQETGATDPEVAPPADGFYYLVRAWRKSDSGSWGSDLRDGQIAVCP